MKKNAIILIAAALLLSVFLLSVSGCSTENPSETTEQYSVYQADGMKDRERGGRVLLTELKQDDFHLYSEGEYVILVHNGQETEFSDWSKNITVETPDMYYYDFNGDGEKELLIRAFEDTDEKTGESIYCLYALIPKADENGEIKYTVCYGGRSAWRPTFSEKVVSEMTQPVSCDKRLQFVMANANSTMAYDTATGLLKDGRAWYAAALSDGKGHYYHFDKWIEGLGVYTINEKDMSIHVEIGIFVSYKETDTLQKIGHINCGIELSGSTFQIQQRSVTFTTENEYFVSDPRKTADEPWTYTFSNTAAYSSNDKVIDNLTMRCNLNDDSRNEQTSFSNSTNDLRAIGRVVFENDKITFYAKSGFTFSDGIVKNRNYTVTASNIYTFEIGYSAAITQLNGTQALVITLDKSYPIEEMLRMNINLGS